MVFSGLSGKDVTYLIDPSYSRKTYNLDKTSHWWNDRGSEGAGSWRGRKAATVNAPAARHADDRVDTRHREGPGSGFPSTKRPGRTGSQ